MNYVMSKWELNKIGFQGRLENFELNSMDWQLYHSDTRMADAQEAVIELNDALREAVKDFTDWRTAQVFMRKVMERHVDVGACDTEPDTVLCDFLAYHFNCETSRW